MRTSVLAIVAWAAVARADAERDVAAVVIKLVKATASDHHDAAAPLLTADPLVATGDGSSDTPPHYTQLFGADAGEAKLAAGTPTVVVSGRFAWFHVTVDASYVQELMNANGPNRTRDRAQVRVSGIAVDDHGWKIAAVMLSNVVSERWLRAQHGQETRPAKLDAQGDSPAGAVARWLYDGALASHAAKGTLVANGTAPGELGGVKLAKGWDTLKLWPATLKSSTFGDFAFVYGEVFMPLKEGAAHMMLAAIVVKSADGWRWQCLNFAPGPP
jgi:hypothetical protein